MARGDEQHRLERLPLAERFRPKLFAEVVGQDRVKAFLQNEVRTRRGRSVLLHGPPGCGKTSLGRIYAHALLCQRGHDEPCFEMTSTSDEVDDGAKCEDCVQFLKGRHPNFEEWDDGSKNSEYIIKQIRLGSTTEELSGGWQIVLIDDASRRLTADVVDAVHKSVERISQKTTFVLSAEHIDALPERVRDLFPSLAVDSASMPARLALLERVCNEAAIEVEREALELIAWQAGGSLRRVLRDLDQLVDGRLLTEGRVREHYHLQDAHPVLRYLEALTGSQGLEAQCEILEEWQSPPDRKIATIEACLSGLWRRHLLRQTGDRTVVDQLDWSRREELAGAFLSSAERRGVSPRLLWHSAITTFRSVPQATDAQLLLKAEELD